MGREAAIKKKKTGIITFLLGIGGFLFVLVFMDLFDEGGLLTAILIISGITFFIGAMTWFIAKSDLDDIEVEEEKAKLIKQNDEILHKREQEQRVHEEERIKEKILKQKEEEQRLAQKKQEIYASIQSIWPYRDQRKIAIKNEPKEDDDNCYLVWVEVDDQARIIIRAGAFSWVAAVKPSGLYALFNKQVIILTKEYFQWHKTLFPIVNDGPAFKAYEMLSSLKEKSFVDSAIDTNNKDMIDVAPHYHFSFDTEVFRSREISIPDTFINYYFNIMSGDNSVEYSLLMLDAYSNSFNRVFTEAVNNYAVFVNKQDEETTGFFKKYFNELTMRLIEFVHENQQLDLNSVRLEEDSIIDFASNIVKIDYSMGIISNVLADEMTLKWYPGVCKVRNNQVDFIFSVFLEEPRLSDLETNNFIQNIQRMALLKIMQGFGRTASFIDLLITVKDDNTIIISHNAEKGETVERAEYVSLN